MNFKVQGFFEFVYFMLSFSNDVLVIVSLCLFFYMGKFTDIVKCLLLLAPLSCYYLDFFLPNPALVQQTILSRFYKSLRTVEPAELGKRKNEPPFKNFIAINSCSFLPNTAVCTQKLGVTHRMIRQSKKILSIRPHQIKKKTQKQWKGHTNFEILVYKLQINMFFVAKCQLLISTDGKQSHIFRHLFSQQFPV